MSSTQNQQKIAIIGAGILGLLTAYRLKDENIQLDLYDQGGFPAYCASYVAGGMLAPYSEIEHMQPKWVQASLDAIQYWKEFAKNAKTDLDFAQNGSIMIAHAPDRYILERFKDHISHAAPQAGQNVKIKDYEPMLVERFHDGLFLHQEAHINPRHVMDEIISTLQKHEHIQLIKKAHTPSELSDKYDHIIDCRGMNAQNDLANLRSVKGELAIVRNPEFQLSRPVRLMHPRYPLYIVPRKDNIFMIGATQIESDGQGVSLKSTMELLSALYSLHPSFGEAEIIEIKDGLRPSLPDNLPQIFVEDNIIRLNGSFRHGYLLAPLMAGAAIDFIMMRDNAHINILTKGEIHENHTQRQSLKLRGAA